MAKKLGHLNFLNQMCLGYVFQVPVKAPTPDGMALDDALTLLLNIIWRCNNQVCDEVIQVP
jgi:hypothetical protein